MIRTQLWHSNALLFLSSSPAAPLTILALSSIAALELYHTGTPDLLPRFSISNHLL